MLSQKVLKELEEKARELGTRKVLVQLPEGLKPKAREISRELEKAGFSPVISGDPCFGACDLRFLEDYITLHIGHSRMLEDFRVVYWEYRYAEEPKLNRASEIKEAKLGLVTTVQHIDQLDKLKLALKELGKEIYIGDPGPRARYPGQVLGCDAGSALAVMDKVEAFVFLGTGKFHPILVAWETGKKVYCLNPFSGEIEVVTGENLEKEKYLRISKASNARNFGVVTSSKPGQFFLDEAGELARRIQEMGKEARVVVMDEIVPGKLENLGFDAYVIIACPRIVMDDWKNYKAPVLLPDEVQLLLDMG